MRTRERKWVSLIKEYEGEWQENEFHQKKKKKKKKDWDLEHEGEWVSEKQTVKENEGESLPSQSDLRKQIWEPERESIDFEKKE